MTGSSPLSALLLLRIRLLLRQKLGWFALTAGFVFILLSLITAEVSYLAPEKIFLDLALGLSFVAQHFLAILLASQLFAEEQRSRTLHLVLSNGASREHWLWANALGLLFVICCVDLLWFAATWLCHSVFFFGAWPVLTFQIKLLQWASVAIVIGFTQLLSLLLRPLLAMAASASLVFFLYSNSAIEAIFADTTSGRFVSSTWALWIVKATEFLPQLEWLDWKVFLGSSDGKSWSVLFGLLLMSLLWTLFFAVASSMVLRKKDL